MPRGKRTSKKDSNNVKRVKAKDQAKGKGGAASVAVASASASVSAAPAPEQADHETPKLVYPRYRVEPGKRFRLKNLDPDDTGHYKSKDDADADTQKHLQRISSLQERLFAEGKQSLLIVLQAMDTGGKDGTISGVFDGVNPQGCQVWGFKVPTPEEQAHDFLWRIHNKAPADGMIAIFNRSHYEDVLVVRVHEIVPEDVWKARYEFINNWERLLHDSGTTILKFYLHISRDEQKQRLESRRDTPDKQWKFKSGDLAERAHWDDYMAAYEDAINKCSTDDAPWYVIPANKKWYRNLVVSRVIADTLEAMKPQYPKPETGIESIVVPD